MKRFAILVALITVPSPVFAKDYNDANMTVAHDCTKDKTAVINGSTGTFKFTGACTKIVVNGSDVKIVAERADAVTVNGSSNTIAVDTVDRIDVTGSTNTITYKKGTPKTSSLGAENKITKAK